MAQSNYNGSEIAIVGMATRVSGAPSLGDYWRNLLDGVESISSFSEEALRAEGVPEEWLRRPNYVPCSGVMAHVEDFDAEFFGFSPKEAAIMDPQHRHFLECCWEALEDAGHMPERFGGSIGVYAGCGMNAYFMFNVLTNPDLVDSVGLFLLRHTGNDKDFLSTRVSYLLNLTGPSVNIQNACSTSLVAVHVASQSLLNGECDLALAGGVTIEVPHRHGYLYHEGEVLSPDGHCHAFDHRAQGTVFGSGAGVVALRRLSDAIESRDHIYAVIRGSAINNDGAGKVGYLAPSVDGQAAAMIEALAVSGVDADSIGYVECHGTGTAMGDPIEISALTQAFRESSSRTGYCRIGSVKTNIGHLDTAAGVASLIKASMALKTGKIPPSLNFESPNPAIDFENSPFVVNDKLHEWTQANGPRRAAVNSLGVGGTNAHAILEEPPAAPASATSRRPYELLMLSGRNRSALNANAERLADFLESNADTALADVAYTLQAGRRAFDQRRVLACRDRDEAVALLRSNDATRVFTHKVQSDNAEVVFMFPGGGAQYPNMGRGLYETEPVFREHMDRGFALLKERHGIDLKPLIYADAGAESDAAEKLAATTNQLPAIFLIEYALAQLWMSYGLKPAALIGHSVGENTAACVSGVLSFEDCLRVVVLRGELVERTPRGAMLSVEMAPDALREVLGDELDLAIVNAPNVCVASGAEGPIDALQQRLEADGVETRRLRIHVAGHSRLLDPVLGEFGDCLRGIDLRPPKIPYISNRTGSWISPDEATNPGYWVDHLRHTVHFADGVGTLQAQGERVLLEVGPGRALSSLARQHPATKPAQGVVASLRHPEESTADEAFFQTVIGRLWACGVAMDWDRYWGDEARCRVSLPTYAFQRQRYWIEPGKAARAEERAESRPLKLSNVEAWFSRPSWRETPVPAASSTTRERTWLVFMDDAGFGRQVVQRLEQRGDKVVRVEEGDAYRRRSATEFVLSPEHGREGYNALIKDLVGSGTVPTDLLHLPLVTSKEAYRPGSNFFHRNQERGFYSLFFIAQALGDENVHEPMRVTVVSTGMQRTGDEALPYPEKATVLGPCKVIPREYPWVTCKSVDLPDLRPPRGKWFAGRGAVPGMDRLAGWLLPELDAEPDSDQVAYRDGRRFVRTRERAAFAGADGTPRVKDGGVYLLTGGLGGAGFVAAEQIARSAQVRLLLVTRDALPARDTWDGLLRRNGGPSPVTEKIQKVRVLESLGAEVMVAEADVTDVAAMRRAVAEARSRWGAINGVVHAAGLVDDDLIQLKSLSAVEDVFAPKVHGTMVLDAVLADETLDFFLLYSSVSTYVAAPGQVDYVAANEFLNAYAESRAGRGLHDAVAINWGIWSEVGMAARASRHRNDSEVGEVSLPTLHPLFEGRVTDRHGISVMSMSLSPANDWILDEHRTLAGRALVPGTAYLEFAAAALREIGESAPFEIRDLFFFQPLAVADGETRDARVRLTPQDDGYLFEVQSRATATNGRRGWMTHAQATLALHRLDAPGAVDFGSIDARCPQAREADETGGLRSTQEDHARFGPRWRVLRSMAFGDREALARCVLPESFKTDLEDYLLHPALLDYATGFPIRLVERSTEDTSLWVPVSYGRVRVYRPLPGRLTSWARLSDTPSPGDDFALFDVVLADDKGQIVLEAHDYAVKRVESDVAFAEAPAPDQLEYDAGQAARADGAQLSPAEEALEHNLSQGITPAEGAEVLSRLLRTPCGPQVVISSLDVDALKRQADRLAEDVGDSSAKFARPELDNEYVEPEDDVERTLVGFFEELLGVDRVGTQDSFFDLGGHSLIAVRLFARIKKTFNAEYPISVLFEAPTVARVAELIRGTIGDDAATGDDGPRAHTSRYRHLVAMHTGDGGGRTPFFLVAGMFGNVLNLRHLAHLIGTDRPFYGVQARGLYGDEAPHETFEEMARDYLAEIRTVQPNGPYLLGGFSGGGITAYEMAHQLRAAGEEVALLVMLDSILPQSPELTRRDKLVIHWQKFCRQGPRYIYEWARNRVLWEYERIKKRQGPVEEVDDNLHFRSEVIEAAFRAALPRYVMRDLPMALTLFRPKLDKAHVLGPGRVVNRHREFVYDDNDWGRFVDAIEVFEVPGDHDSMVLEPNVRVLAKRLGACIRQAEERISGGGQIAAKGDRHVGTAVSA